MKLVSETEVGHPRTYMGLVSIQYASLSLCYLLKENSRLAMGQAGIQSTEEFRVSPALCKYQAGDHHDSVFS